MDAVRTAAWEGLRNWRASLIFLPLCCYFCLSRGEYTIMDTADLVIHEAGHFIFRFFGDFLHMAGGTILQLLLPALLAWHFFSHDYRFGTQVSLLWLGQSFINVSVYAADARARALPLLGGSKVTHDWHYLLREFGLLEYDAAIGCAFFGMGIIVFAALLLLPLALPYYVQQAVSD